MKAVNNSGKSQIILILVFVVTVFGIFSNLTAVEKPALLEKKEIVQVVDSLSLQMFKNYVFPEKGKEVSDLLKKNLQEGIYNTITDPKALAVKLTEDIRSLTNDRHLSVTFDPESIALLKNDAKNKTEDYAKRQAYLDRKNNYGFKEIKILKGNVGYLKFNSFETSKEAFETAVAAMTFLINTDALIIDLTENGGGYPSMIQLLTSYFFENSANKALNTFYYRPTDSMEYTYTLPFVPGKTRPDWDIYVLTSKYTFSGAEEFTYNLKNLKRATIVGETTGGGAHPIEQFILTDKFMANIAFGRAINPITKTNWEGVGVKPDYETTPEKALDKALMLSYEKQISKQESPKEKALYQWAIEALKAKENPVVLDKTAMKAFVGVYGPRHITLENGELYYQREGFPKIKMIPMTKDIFRFNDVDYFRLKFVIEKDKVIALEGMYDDGRSSRNERTK